VIDGSPQEAGVSSIKRTQDARIDDAGVVHSDEKPKKGLASKGAQRVVLESSNCQKRV
jgi:hypothetical protein